MKQIEMTGKTINEAVDKACEQLGVSLLDVEYKIIDEPSKGIFGIGAKPAKVLVTVVGEEEDVIEPSKPVEVEKSKAVKEEKQKKVKVEKPKAVKAEEPKAVKAEEPKVVKVEEPKAVKSEEPKAVEVETPEVVEETNDDDKNESARASLTDEDKANILASATNFLQEVFQKMNMAVEFDASFTDNKHILVEMNGEDMGSIIGKRGQTLDSIQYLTNLVVNKGDYPYMNVTLDTEGYRAKRQKTLEQLAFNLAKKAKHNRRNITLEPMNPYERRIIHATLQNDRYVTTHSEGTEPYRYVVITLKNSYSASRKSYRRNDR